MRIPQLGVKRKKAVVLLGAGASRGASCFNDKLIKAPLDTDFFEVLQRVRHKNPLLQTFSEFQKNEFGDGIQPRMEELFTKLEALKEFHSNLNINRGPRIKKYDKHLSKFVEMTAALFHEIFLDASGNPLSCDYHKALAKALNAGDTIITFNYDCLIDSSLKNHAGIQWDTKSGYGLKVDRGAEYWHTSTGIRGRRPQKPIQLLKLHGSLNWDRSGQLNTTSIDISLRLDPYETTNRHHSEIVPPVWNKTVSNDEVFKTLWKLARLVLPTGAILVVAGYSVPQTDLLSQALIRVAAQERSQKLTHLVVVNPDQQARMKLIELVKPGLSSRTVIVELSFMKELQELLT